MGVRLLLLLQLVASPLAGQALELRFLDVGQGDAVLIRSGGKEALVDAGRGAGIVARLAELGVDSLDLFIASHNHADHIGGAEEILGALPVRFYMDNGLPSPTQTWQRLIALVRDRGIAYLEATDRTVILGAARLRILPPPFPRREASQNNSSVGVVVELGAFRALLTGDSEGAELARWLATEDVPDVDVLKAAHHGAANGVSAPWLERTKPEVVVISVGRNSYGHPHATALGLYAATADQVLRTDQSGDIVVAVAEDGSYRITTGAGTANRARAPPAASRAPAAAAPRDSAPAACCRVCRTGKACGNSCIARSRTCHQPPGCACDGRP
jgi:beta-lactamase superfamily II metal-dependent hydrolase